MSCVVFCEFRKKEGVRIRGVLFVAMGCEFELSSILEEFWEYVSNWRSGFLLWVRMERVSNTVKGYIFLL